MPFAERETAFWIEIYRLAATKAVGVRVTCESQTTASPDNHIGKQGQILQVHARSQNPIRSRRWWR
jgi:hypothetical protein